MLSLLFLFSNSDMLTKVSVIFSFKNSSLIARYFKKKVILKPYGFSVILSAS